MKTLKIANGNKTGASYGHRSIVLDPQGQPRPVQSVDTRGPKGLRCTYQIARDWDLVITHSYTPYKFEIHILMDGELSLYKGYEPSTVVDIQYRLKDLPGVFKWLISEAGEHYLPDGIGWENGITQSQINKNERIRSFFKGVPESVLEMYISLAVYSAYVGLPMNWQDAESLPDILEVHAEFFDGNLASVDQQDEWVLYYNDGTVRHLRPQPTSGEWSYADRRQGRGDYNAIPLDMPEDVIKAIKITIHPYRRDCSSYGIKWQLYKR